MGLLCACVTPKCVLRHGGVKVQLLCSCSIILVRVLGTACIGLVTRLAGKAAPHVPSNWVRSNVAVVTCQ